MEGLNWQLLQLPFAAGLDQKSDDRARKSTALDIARDVQFDDLGGLQTRLPYADIGAAIHGGGTITNPRRIVENGSELLLFTKDELLSWSAGLGQWVRKGTHLAAKVEEQTVFANTTDQQDPDRAELSGVVVYTWATGAATGVVMVAAYDKTTGAVVLEPYEVSNDGTRPKLVALDDSIILTWYDVTAGKLFALVLDVADLETTVADTPIDIDTINLHYDICRIPGVNTAIGVYRKSPTTAYGMFTITSAGSFALSSKARTCTGAIAIAVDPTNTQAMVVRANGTAVQGDLITIAAFADTAHLNIAIGTTPVTAADQIAACFSTTAESGPVYRCYAFWSSGTSDAGGWGSQRGSATTGGTAGGSADFVRVCAIASRAFCHDGAVYVHVVFAGNSDFVGLGSLFDQYRNTLQNTTFLYRQDGFLVAKILGARSGEWTSTTGCLPHVELTGTGTWSWAATERRAIETGSNGNHMAYDDRGPCDVTIVFDSNEARRCARFGETLYITGGELLQYDGVELTEVGFHIYPWRLSAFEVNGAGGSLEDGTYAIKATWRSDNARGERDRSTTATHGDVAFTGGTPQKLLISGMVPLYTTHKAAAVEIWRTKKDPIDESPFFLATAKDPAVTSNPNRYVTNDLGLSALADITDELSDAEIEDNEASPENVGTLENVAPPACSIIAASENRLYIAGIPGLPDTVQYSKYREPGLVAGFNDALTVTVPHDGGDITAIAFLNETLIVFREHAVYALPGDGFDNNGGGVNYGPARTLSGDVGAVNQESVCFTPGGLVFKSSKGWYLLNRGWSLDYIGAPISDYDAETPLAAHLVEKQHQVRILTSARMLVWDYLAQQWAEWTISNGLGACMWTGAHVYLAANAPKKQGTAYTGLTYALDVETAWIKPADLQGFVRARKLQILGSVRSATATLKMRVRLKYDYVETVVDDKYWDISPRTVGAPLQLKFGPRRQQFQAIKVRLTAVIQTSIPAEDPEDPPTLVDTAPTDEAFALTGLALEVGTKRGLYPRLPAAQRS